MHYTEARQYMIQTWGALSTHWGITRGMGQIHALLMVSPVPLSAEQIMEELDLSRGIVSMHLRSLLEWRIVHKAIVTGERKDYFTAEKDIWKVALQIAGERKRRELDPLIQSLQQLSTIDDDPALTKEIDELRSVTDQIMDVAMQLDKILEIGVRSGSQPLLRKLINVLR